MKDCQPTSADSPSSFHYRSILHSSFFTHHSSFVICHSSFFTHHSSLLPLPRERVGERPFTPHSLSFSFFCNDFYLFSFFALVIAFLRDAYRNISSRPTRNFSLGRAQKLPFYQTLQRGNISNFMCEFFIIGFSPPFVALQSSAHWSKT